MESSQGDGDSILQGDDETRWPMLPLQQQEEEPIPTIVPNHSLFHENQEEVIAMETELDGGESTLDDVGLLQVKNSTIETNSLKLLQQQQDEERIPTIANLNHSLFHKKEEANPTVDNHHQVMETELLLPRKGDDDDDIGVGPTDVGLLQKNLTMLAETETPDDRKEPPQRIQPQQEESLSPSLFDSFSSGISAVAKTAISILPSSSPSKSQIATTTNEQSLELAAASTVQNEQETAFYNPTTTGEKANDTTVHGLNQHRNAMRSSPSTSTSKTPMATATNPQSQLAAAASTVQNEHATPLHNPTTNGGKSIDTTTTFHGSNHQHRKRPPSRKDLRRKNRRRLHRLLQKPGTLPSFLKVIEERKSKKIKTEQNNDNLTKQEQEEENVVVEIDDSDDESFLLEPPMVVIDVDEYLGLKKKQQISDAILSASLVPSSQHNSLFSNPLVGSSSNDILPTPQSSSSSMKATLANNNNSGYYEGSRPMAVLPDDAMYLTENQQSIRKNMEYFTATVKDVMASSHRKTPIVVGRVGFRCVHCARAMASGRISKMPPASVSFPKNFTALYNLTIQKQQMHMDLCPHVPPDQKSGAIQKSRKRQMTSIPAVAYWQISCKRLGIVELENNQGLRFSRDPKLEPLDFETVRSQVEQEQPHLIPRNHHQSYNYNHNSPTAATEQMTPVSALSTTTTSMNAAATDSASLNIPNAVMDVLQEAKRDHSHDSLISIEDAKGLSDFMFLTIQQAALCHAVKEDFLTRGKKTRLMRLGYAGFCCRHCKKNYYYSNNNSTTNSTPKMNPRVFQNSCRSFSSSRDTIGSAMSNSFVLHLMKCEYTPLKIKQALQSLKKVHSKQMHRLPYGSQSGVFLKIWQNIRTKDKPPLPGDAAALKPRAFVKKEQDDDDDEEYRPETIGSSATASTANPSSKRTRSSRQPVAHYHSVADEKEAREVLREAEEHWDPKLQNDDLVQRADRPMISDFVFLCMRQLRVAIPTGKDMGRTKRMAGFCCIHCSGRAQSTQRSSGRSFPSAPDNIASILNVTIYKHLMNCPSVPTRLKRTIDAVRKSHTQQCASLPYGSQRRYFERVFIRLQNVPLEGVLAAATVKNETNGSIYKSVLQKCAFVRTKNSQGLYYWQCSKCRMVPYDYRAPGSIFFSRPSIDELETHRSVCQQDRIDWSTIRSSLRTLNIKYGGATPLVDRESFSNLIRSVVGSETEVLETFLAKLGKKDVLPGPSSDTGIWRRLPLEVDFDHVQESFSVLRKDLDLPPASLHDTPDVLEFLRLVSCNFQVPSIERFNDLKKESPSSTTTIVGQQTNAGIAVQSQSLGIDDSKTNEETISLDRLLYSAASPTNDSKRETSLVNQSLTWDQGINVMDNIEAGQFDDA